MGERERRIIIAGVGLVSPLGLSAWETFRALLAGKTMADRVAKLPADIATVDLIRAVGCVAAVQHVASQPGDPSIELAERAAREAMYGQAGEEGGGRSGEREERGEGRGARREGREGEASRDEMTFSGWACPGISFSPGTEKGSDPFFQADPFVELRPAISLGVSKGAMHALMRAEREPNVIAMGPHGYLAAHLSRRLGLPVKRSIVAACASSLTALHHARLSMLHGEEESALVVTSEAALLPMFIGSYQRLGVLPPTPGSALGGSYAGRPLDKRRNGFMLAELGAAVLLRSVDRVATGQIELLDTAIAADAYDMIRPSPRMDALRHIAGQLLHGRKIDLLHPHATGTAEHDPAEMAVYADCGATIDDVYACKGAIGHGLGAAGLVSLVLACLCARANRRPPMPWLRDPIDTPLPVRAEMRPRPRNGAMTTQAVFAAGFGGHVAGAVIGKT